MTKEEILAMAKEAGDPECVSNEPDSTGHFYMHTDEVIAFFHLAYAAGQRDMQRRLAECERDAERYRLLKSKARSVDVVCWNMDDHGWQISIVGDHVKFDEAVDAAIAKVGADKGHAG